MTGLIRRLWYLALGALAAWAWHRIRHAAQPDPWLIRADVEVPAALLPHGAAGLGFNVHFFRDASADGEDGGIDDATGLPRFGRPGDAPESEQ